MKVNSMQPNKLQLSQASLATALGLSPPSITKLKRRGMPTHSVQAAVEWRRNNLAMDMRSKRLPAFTLTDTTVAEVTALGELALKAVEIGHFAAVEPRLRAAIRLLPESESPVLPMEVWDALTADFRATLDEHFPDATKAEGSPAAETRMSDEEAEWMGRFWREVVCERVRINFTAQ